MTPVRHRGPRWRWAVAAVTGSLLAGITAVTSASGALPRAPRLKAVLAVTPRHAAVAQNVTADLRRSTLPAGTTLKRLTVSWGDGTRPVTLPSLRTEPVHHYARPGTYLVKAMLTDNKHRSATATQTETVALLPGIYWDLFSGSSASNQLEHTSLPLTTESAYASISGTSHNKLRCTAGEAIDSKGRLWILSHPSGCVAPFRSILTVFTLPISATSAPILTFTLPGKGDDDNLAFDQSGNLWVGDAYHSAVYEFTGPFPSSRTLIPALTLTSGINTPGGVAVNSEGDVFVANVTSTGTHSIAVFEGPVTSSTVPTFLNGLTAPGGLVFDSHGSLYASSNPANGVGAALVRYNSDDLGNGATPSITDRAGAGGKPYEAGLAWDAAGNLYEANCGQTGSIEEYPLATKPFSTSLAPSLVYANSTTTSVGCVWGIAIH